jgi:hypothetical protein
MTTLTPTYSPGGAAAAGTSGVPASVQVDLKGTVVVPGGSATVAIAAGASTVAQVVKASAGRLCRIIVTTTGTADLKFYDNASAASGTVIGYIPSAATLGQSFDIQMPASNGITAGLLNGSAAVTVSYY